VTKTKPNKADQIATLKRKNMELEAQLSSTYHFVGHGLIKADRSRTLGSGVLVQLAYLGGREVCKPFVLKDGLSDATIEAICEDLRYSYAKSMEFKPLGFKV
jgi:hypothetical protein